MKKIFLLITLIQIIYCYSFGQTINSVERKTSRPISCEELNCIDNGGEYEDESRICLNCFMKVSDSILKSEVNRYMVSLNENQKERDSFMKKQRKWESNVKKRALSISNQYKGGVMEMTEFVREKLLQTKRRIDYVRTLNSKY